MIKIDFERGTDPWIYKDALHLPDDHTLTDAEIEAMKDDRYTKWYDMVTNPPQPTEEIALIIPVINPDDYVEVNGVRYYKPAE
jgi:hypothetical protein